MHQTGERPRGKKDEGSNDVQLELERDIRHQRDIRLERENRTEPHCDRLTVVVSTRLTQDLRRQSRRSSQEDGAGQEKVHEDVIAASCQTHRLLDNASIQEAEETNQRHQASNTTTNDGHHVVGMLAHTHCLGPGLRNDQTHDVAASNTQNTEVE